MFGLPTPLSVLRNRLLVLPLLTCSFTSTPPLAVHHAAGGTHWTDLTLTASPVVLGLVLVVPALGASRWVVVFGSVPAALQPVLPDAGGTDRARSRSSAACHWQAPAARPWGLGPTRRLVPLTATRAAGRAGWRPLEPAVAGVLSV